MFNKKPKELDTFQRMFEEIELIGKQAGYSGSLQDNPYKYNSWQFTAYQQGFRLGLDRYIEDNCK